MKTLPILEKTIGKRPECKHPNGSKSYWEVVDEVRQVEKDLMKKFLYYKRLKANPMVK